jgi:5-formyltetrahydrofolate cyclo-ligase
MSQTIQSERSREKSRLRQQFRADRRSLSQTEWQEKSASICQAISQFPKFQTADRVLAFFSTNREPDLSLLWQEFPEKTWGFPKTLENRQMQWHQIKIENLDSSRAIGRYGIYEPLPSLPLINLAQVDLILVPAVACDRQGIRLGNGGGYYDTFLAEPSLNPHSYKLGIIFELTLVDHLPYDPWDIHLDGICTEFGIQATALR